MKDLLDILAAYPAWIRVVVFVLQAIVLALLVFGREQRPNNQTTSSSTSAVNAGPSLPTSQVVSTPPTAAAQSRPALDGTESPDKGKVVSAPSTAAASSGQRANDEPRGLDRVADEIVVKKGQAEVHKATGAVIGVMHVSVNQIVDLNLTLPGQPTIEEKEVPPGRIWRFTTRGRNYRVILRRADFITDLVTLEIGEDE